MNLAGEIAPPLAAILAIPFIVRGLGVARFGVLSLIWMLSGYLLVFDGGLGRSLTKLIAERVHDHRYEEIPFLYTSSLAMLAVLGLSGCALLLWISPWIVQRAFTVGPELRAETVRSLDVVAFSLPILITIPALQGTLAAYERFGKINAVRVPAGVYYALSPLVVLTFSNSLVWVVVFLMAGRVAVWVVYFCSSWRLVPKVESPALNRRALLGESLRFGGWVTLSNVISPIMTIGDRFLIGSLISVSAAGYYAAPFDAINRLAVLPSAVTMTIFPALSRELSKRSNEPAKIFDSAARSLLLLMFVPLFVVVTFAPELLRVWLGVRFENESANVVRWVGIGLLFNGQAYVAFTTVQAAHRPDLGGMLHIAEFVPYILVLWLGTARWGISGAAFAWAMRVIVDSLVLFAMAVVLVPNLSASLRRLAPAFGAAAAIMVLGTAIPEVSERLILTAGVLPMAVVFGWRMILQPSERDVVRSFLRLPQFAQ